MTNVVSFTGERLTPVEGNAGLAEHLRWLAGAIEEGIYGECQLASVVLLDGNAKVRVLNRSARHFLQSEYLGILDIAKHQVLTDSFPEEPEGGAVA